MGSCPDWSRGSQELLESRGGTPVAAAGPALPREGAGAGAHGGHSEPPEARAAPGRAGIAGSCRRSRRARGSAARWPRGCSRGCSRGCFRLPGLFPGLLPADEVIPGRGSSRAPGLFLTAKAGLCRGCSRPPGLFLGGRGRARAIPGPRRYSRFSRRCCTGAIPGPRGYSRIPGSRGRSGWTSRCRAGAIPCSQLPLPSRSRSHPVPIPNYNSQRSRLSPFTAGSGPARRLPHPKFRGEEEEEEEEEEEDGAPRPPPPRKAGLAPREGFLPLCGSWLEKELVWGPAHALDLLPYSRLSPAPRAGSQLDAVGAEIPSDPCTGEGRGLGVPVL
ncbi:uncharacterized protein LOC121356986 [Pyrgilauda ruficollis]|uniref:uncharacterized protein LOC121356986 n=1 Tax=Pyrgilauda ruficollis TaxID=221976 RepID=UPI001B875755|nr:uncharacterized protein LOC121356986 [Pyrgilauda ruficollis]